MSHIVMESSPGDILAEINAAFSPDIRRQLLVVGSTAIAATIGADARQPRDHDVMGSQALVQDITRQALWTPPRQ